MVLCFFSTLFCFSTSSFNCVMRLLFMLWSLWMWWFWLGLMWLTSSRSLPTVWIRCLCFTFGLWDKSFSSTCFFGFLFAGSVETSAAQALQNLNKKLKHQKHRIKSHSWMLNCKQPTNKTSTKLNKQKSHLLLTIHRSLKTQLITKLWQALLLRAKNKATEAFLNLVKISILLKL